MGGVSRRAAPSAHTPAPAPRAGVRARGANVVGEPREAWGRLRVAYLRDPEGNLIELQQWLVTRA